MFNNTAIDVTIGLIFIFLLYSLLATIIQEIIAHWISMRPRILIKSIAVMLDKENKNSGWRGFFESIFLRLKRKINPFTDRVVTEKFYNQPSIKFLGESESKKPSYITSTTFSETLLRMMKGDNPSLVDDPLIAIRESVQKNLLLLDNETSSHLQHLLSESSADIALFKEKLENWFNETQARATGWYKKQTQFFLLIIGFSLAAANNVDTIAIYKILSTNSAAREQMANMAVVFKEKGIYEKVMNKEAAKETDNTELIKHFQELDSLAKESKAVMGLGWDNKSVQSDTQSDCWFIVFIGWLITAIMISLGAPFWFDMLNKVAQIRGSGTKEGAGTDKTLQNDSASVPASKRKG